MIVTVVNGNYKYDIDLETGTKIKYIEDCMSLYDLKPEYPETIDIKITDKCSHNCPFCYENSKKDGKHADYDKLIKLFKTLNEYTEVAIGGGNPLEYPRLIELVKECRKLNLIPNITVNFKDIISGRFTPEIAELFYGIGVSVNFHEIKKEYKGIFDKYKNKSNFVFHIILGLNDVKTVLKQLIELENIFGDKIKILVLGYKKDNNLYYKDNRETIDKNIEEFRSIVKNLGVICKCVGFDTLAVEQLRLHELFDKELFNERYNGEDGLFSMFIDFVSMEYSISSYYGRDKMIKINDNEIDIKLMFKNIRKLVNNK